MNFFKKYQDLKNKTMSPAKRAQAKNDFFAFYVGRPISYWLTLPFLNTSITPNQVSYLSIIPLLCASFIMSTRIDTFALLISWFSFFFWNLMDGVDGNLARYRQQYSKDGSVVDAMIGYAAMFLTFFSVGIAASNITQQSFYIILGALSGVFQLFPRLVMHKYINTVGEDASSSEVKQKADYSPIKIFALNLTSITGLPQVFLLISICLNLIPHYTIFYFVINYLMMLMSLYTLFKN
ncbi:CDP-alcohol phosphatidyltransferase family protein [Streptococcus sp. 121]|uniref:CDP-alcohol phosphatidyltransferase family protein n=1 Tax=Streptococcus sp. 121 TaxID=2797637 RepID=UPI0018F0A49F|nr:CDP-alcohol phosphatidyltransferase family protein [Streptococcus sp. 121]MBJ6746078.1 CDP-alcohol phosphatidyltransferase family protein [Streptococcus sp. 121]